MMAKELLYSDKEEGNEESTLLQDPYDDEEEETLSFCDLPIYSGSISSSQSSDFSKEDGKSSRSNSKNDDDDDDDFFEFFSEEFTTTTTHATADNNIIFCGKLIPFKDHPHRGKKNLQSNNTTKSNNIQKGEEEQEAKGSKSFASDYKSMGNKGSLVRCTTKSRWFMFMFGMSKLSNTTNEMQLRDIRNRQSRRAPATMFPAPEENGKEVTVKGRRNFKKMWKMLSMVFGCSSSSSKLANDVVKAAFV